MTATETIKTTCPRDCYDACGMIVNKRNGVIANVLGDPDHHITRGLSAANAPSRIMAPGAIRR